MAIRLGLEASASVKDAQVGLLHNTGSDRVRDEFTIPAVPTLVPLSHSSYEPTRF